MIDIRRLDSVRFSTMYPNGHSKPFDSGVDLYPTCSPTSSYPPRSLCGRHTLSRHVKVASESLAQDFFQRFPSPDPVDTRKEAILEDKASSPDEDSDLPQSRSVERLVLASKDRLRSASLEWTLSNGSVTPRATHYHTHPPLDFKSLKEKLRQLTGSPDDPGRKPLPGISGHEKQRKGVVTTLPVTMVDSNPGGRDSYADVVKQTVQKVEAKTTGASFFPNVPYVATERLLRTPPEEIDASKPIKITLRKTSINQSANELDGETVEVLWIDLAQHVAQKDDRLQKLLNRHSEELEELKKKHKSQWVDLHHKLSESVIQDLSQSIPLQSQQPNSSIHKFTQVTRGSCAVPETGFEVHADGPADRLEIASQAEHIGRRYINQEGIDHRPLSAQEFDPSDYNVKQIVGHSLSSSAVATHSDVCRVEEVDGESTGKDFHRCVDGAGNLSRVCDGGNRMETGVTQHLPAQVQSHAPSTTKVHRQMEHEASQSVEPHISRRLVEATQPKMKNPPVQQQVESRDWHQMLEMFQRLQAAASLEQWILRQPILRQVLMLQEIAEAQAQAAKFHSHRLLNRQCTCARPSCLSQSFLPTFYKQPHYSADPYTALNLAEQAGIDYSSQIPLFPQLSVIQQSPYNELSSYYYPESLAYSTRTMFSSPDQWTCQLLEASRNQVLSAAAVLGMSPPPMPLLPHLVAGQSPHSLGQAHLSSLCSSPALPPFTPQPVFPFSPTQTPLPSDAYQRFSPLNPLTN